MMDLADTSYIAAEVRNVVLSYTEKQTAPIALKVDVEFINCPETCKWKPTDGAKYSTETVTAEPKGEAEAGATEFPYTCQFPDGFLTSCFIEMTKESMASMINGSIAIKVGTQTESTVAGAKGAKEVVKVDDVLVEVTIPIASLFTVKGCAVAASDSTTFAAINAGDAGLPSGVVVKVNKPNISAEGSSLSFRVAGDNDLGEFLLGAAVFRWESASLSVVPSSAWTLKAPDVIDPKAKVPATAEELRAKYLENIAKLLATQSEQLQFSVTVGGSNNKDKVEAEAEAAEAAPAGIAEHIPALTIGKGTLAFNAEAAAEVPIEEDIREKLDLWSLEWSPANGCTASQFVFFHRTDWLKLRKFVQYEQENGSGAGTMAQVTVVCAPGTSVPEGSVETSTATASVDLAVLQEPGCSTGNAVTQLDAVAVGAAEAVPVEAASGLVLRFVASKPLVACARPASASLPAEGERLLPAKSSSDRATKNVNRDVMGELRDEISHVVRQIALEYVALYPQPQSQSAGNNKGAGDVAAPLTQQSSNQQGNSPMVNQNQGPGTSQGQGQGSMSPTPRKSSSPGPSTPTRGGDAAGSGAGGGGAVLDADRKSEFMYYLSTSGVYHALKEKLKPRIQRAVREMYGVRGRATKPNTGAGGGGQFIPPAGFESEAEVPLDALLGELYVFLIKETNTVLNELYESTVVKRDMIEIERSNRVPSGAIAETRSTTPGGTGAPLEANAVAVDDEKETTVQSFERNLQMANNAEADERYWVAEQYHLERIQMVKNCPIFADLVDHRHSAYTAFGEFMQRRAAWTLMLAKASSAGYAPGGTAALMSPTGGGAAAVSSPSGRNGSGGDSAATASLLFEDAQYFTARARQALEIAIEINPFKHETVVLLASILLESGEQERAEVLVKDMMDRFVGGDNAGFICESGSEPIESFAFDDFDGYSTDQLVSSSQQIDPMCYVLLAIMFATRGSMLSARKAILMANKCYAASTDSYPPVSNHGKPKRTAVVNLVNGALYFYEFGLITLGNAAYTLASESDRAVTAKAQARKMFADTVPFVRHLLKRAECMHCLYNNESGSDGLMQALDVANACVSASVAAVDVCQAWLLVARVLSISMHDMSALMDAYSQAMVASAQAENSLVLDAEVGSVASCNVPLHDILCYSKLLITAGGNKYNEALRLLLSECRTRSTSASLFLYMGICCLRLERLADAEDALQEANLLESRNPDIWAYLSLFILLTGSMHRIEEAEKALAQAIRLGLNNNNLIRELAVSYMSVDRLVVAEDLVRRALALECGGAGAGAGAGAGGSGALVASRGTPHTRKLMADILSAQNQAAKAVSEYQGILSDGEVELPMRINAGERCMVLLSSLGRDEDVKALSGILENLRDANRQQ